MSQSSGIPVRIVRTDHRIQRNGRLSRAREAWEAVSVDGQWRFERLEEPGTPWLVTHRDLTGWTYLAGSLRRARRDARAQLGLDLAVSMIAAVGHVPHTANRIQVRI